MSLQFCGAMIADVKSERKARPFAPYCASGVQHDQNRLAKGSPFGRAGAKRLRGQARHDRADTRRSAGSLSEQSYRCACASLSASLPSPSPSVTPLPKGEALRPAFLFIPLSAPPTPANISLYMSPAGGRSASQWPLRRAPAERGRRGRSRQGSCCGPSCSPEARGGRGR